MGVEPTGGTFSPRESSPTTWVPQDHPVLPNLATELTRNRLEKVRPDGIEPPRSGLQPEALPTELRPLREGETTQPSSVEETL